MLFPQDVPLALDGRMLIDGGTGVSSYSRALAAAQRSLTVSSLVVHDASSSGDDAGGKWRRRLRTLWPVGVRARWEEGTLRASDLFRLAQVYFDVHRRLLRVEPPMPGGIMHWSYPVPLHMVGWHNVYTVHDVIPLIAPELTHIDPVRHAALLGRIARSAEAVVTVSEASRIEIAAALDMPLTKIVNCSQAISLAGSPGPAPADLPAGRYLLAIGTVERRKNIARLVDAYRRSGATLPLVIAGPAGSGRSAAALEVEIATTAQVIRLPYVAASDVPGLIANARALVMPSLAEGFGLPVAEAMSLGTPVITSDRGALAETAGGAAMLVPPEDVAAIAHAIGRICHSDEECARFARAGRINARRFTMEPFANRLRDLYCSLLPPQLTLDTHGR